MVLLGACEQLCADLTATVGPSIVQTVGMVAGLVLVWWRGRKQTQVAVEQASKAKGEARAAQVQLAEIKGSLRPVTVTGTGSSGLYEPVAFPEPAKVPGPPTRKGPT
jgi:hypothetical protein